MLRFPMSKYNSFLIHIYCFHKTELDDLLYLVIDNFVIAEQNKLISVCLKVKHIINQHSTN